MKYLHIIAYVALAVIVSACVTYLLLDFGVIALVAGAATLVGISEFTNKF